MTWKGVEFATIVLKSNYGVFMRFIEEIIENFRKNKCQYIDLNWDKDDLKQKVYNGMLYTCRFNGMVRQPINLIEHCIFVQKLCKDECFIFYDKQYPEKDLIMCQIIALTHDIGEVIVGDFVYPIKKDFLNKNDMELIKVLEEKFIDYFMRTVFSFEIERNKDIEKIVTEMDYFAGKFEMLGVSMNVRSSTFYMFQAALNELKKNINVNGDPIGFYNQLLTKKINQFKEKDGTSAR